MNAMPEVDLRLRDDWLLAGEHRLRLTEACANVIRQLLQRPNALLATSEGEEAPEEVLEQLGALNVYLEAAAPGRWFIAHLPGQGLMLITRSTEATASSRASSTRPLPDLPATFVGRDELARNLEAALQQRRLVSVVGPGGMGKTTVAVAVARRLAPSLPDGVCFLDLAKLSSGERLGAELATALGIESPKGEDFDPLKSFLRDKHMLIVLDSCETVVDAAAKLAEELLASAPQVLLLVTSREPLQANGEWVHRLPPLTSPPEEASLPTWLAMTYPAMQLFCRIAEDRQTKVAVTQETLELMATVCRKLDGSPLAIALAASHVPRLGLRGIAEQVGRRMLTLPSMAGAAGRHQTLEAVLDWSYQLLLEPEKRAFCSLATFRGGFDLEAAVDVVNAENRAAALSTILDLVSKSLLMPLQVGDAVLYRMPDMTREFAEGQLQKVDCAEYRAARQRHALYLIRMLALGDRQWNSMGRAEWRRRFGAWVEDVRHALRWAFSEDGDALVAIELTAGSWALAEQTALFADYDGFAGHALNAVQSLDPPRPDLAVRLYIIPCINQYRWLNNDVRQFATLSKAVEIGQNVGTADAQLGSLLATWALSFQLGDYPATLPWCATMQALADDHADAIVELTARRTRAQTLHFLGDHARARTIALALCAHPNTRIPLSYTPSPVSTDVSMRILLARIQWIEGHADQARRTLDECLELARHDAPQSLCQVLGVAAIPVALWSGWGDACQSWVAQLVEQAGRYDYLYWQHWGGLYQALLAQDGRCLPETVLVVLQPANQTKFRDHIGTFNAAYLSGDALARVEAGSVGWCAPEVLRIQAEREMAAGSLGTAATYLERSMKLARAQGALAWELRAAMTALQLSQLTGNRVHGRRVLASVYDRFAEGFATRDLRGARRLLERMD
jgi:predicted ATPase